MVRFMLQFNKMIRDKLKKIVSGEVSVNQEILEKYSRDYSIFKVKPQAVVFPRNVEDVKKLVKFATKNKISLTARSGGTDMTGGPLNDGIILDFTHYFNKVKKIPPKLRSAAVFTLARGTRRRTTP